MEIRPDTVLANRYTVLEKIGEGCFGRVYKGLDLQQKDFIAIKQMPFSKFQEQPKVKELFQAEVSILKRVRNENVVSYVDYFTTTDSCFLVIEYCDSGDLEAYLKQRKTIPEEEAIEFFKQILNGFKGLHEIPAIHRDLKAANILIHNKNILKIADLGFGKILKDGDMARTVLGTSMTMAPEVLESKSYSIEVDVYSLGVILYLTLFGVFPYNGRSDAELLNQIKTKPLNLQPNQIKISNEMKDLLQKMICYSRETRIKWPQLYQHPIFAQQKKNNANNVSLAHLYSSQVQIGLNRDFYEKNGEGLYKNKFGQDPTQEKNQQYNQNFSQNNQINYQFIPPQPPQNMNNQFKNNNEPNRQQMPPVSFQNEEITKIKEQANQNRIIKENINHVVSRYLHFRNVYGQMIKAIDSAHQLPRTQVNTFVPVFLIQKKLYCMNRQLLISLEKKENIFKLDYFPQFLQSPFYQKCLELVKDEELIIKLYFDQLREEVLSMLAALKQPDLTLKIEIGSEELTNKYQELIQSTIVNYVMNFEDIRSNFKQQEQQKVFVHLVRVMDCLSINKLLKDYNFNFEKYSEDLENVPFKDYSDVLGMRLNLLFDV